MTGASLWLGPSNDVKGNRGTSQGKRRGETGGERAGSGILRWREPGKTSKISQHFMESKVFMSQIESILNYGY